MKGASTARGGDTNIHIHERKQYTRNRQADPMDSEKVLWFNPKFG